jgi:hypothetical protein
MAVTRFASQVRRVSRVVSLSLSALLLAGVGMLAAPAAPASAASAISVTISGETVVRDWDTAYYVVRVKNTGTTTLSNIYLEIYHSALPLDFDYMFNNGGATMECGIIDGSALGGAKAACELASLGVGQKAEYQLRTSTTWAGSYRVKKLRVQAFHNFPASATVDATDYLDIAVNP